MSDTYLGNPNLKSVGQPVEWTEESVIEYQKCMEDPQYFIENFKGNSNSKRENWPILTHWKKEKIRFGSKSKIIVKSLK